MSSSVQRTIVINLESSDKKRFSDEEKSRIESKLIEAYLNKDILLLRRHIQTCPKCGEVCKFLFENADGSRSEKMLPACSIRIVMNDEIEVIIPSYFIHLLNEHDLEVDSNLSLILS